MGGRYFKSFPGTVFESEEEEEGMEASKERRVHFSQDIYDDESNLEADYFSESKNMTLDTSSWGGLNEEPSEYKRMNRQNSVHLSRLDRHRNFLRQESSEDVIHWKRGNRLGKGSFGTVWCGLTMTGKLIAVKQIEFSSSEVDDPDEEYKKIFQEVDLLSSLRHRNIVRYLGCNYDSDVISIFMQYVPGGSLTSIIHRFGPLDEAVTALYSKQILEALQFLHEKDILHRDIKCDNMMLMPDGVVKLIDFGCAKMLCSKLCQTGSNLQKSMKGTSYWMAPEVIMETGYGKGADIWSLGCSVYEMCTGIPPLGQFEPCAAMFAIGAARPLPPLPDTYSETAQHFVNQCLIRNKHERPSASVLLHHEFLDFPTSKT